MEHRWGVRRTLNIGVKLYIRQSLPKFGRLLNASASGAYVAMSATPAIMSRVHVALGWDRLQRGGRHRVAAYVVRVDARGIGIEWHDFAPSPVLALIESLEVPPAPARRRTPASDGLPFPMHYAALPSAVGRLVSEQRVGTLQAGASGG